MSDYTCRYQADGGGSTEKANYLYNQDIDKYLKTRNVDGSRRITAVLNPLFRNGKLMLSEVSLSQVRLGEFIILTEIIDLQSLEFRQHIMGVGETVDVRTKTGFCIKR